MLFFSKNLLGKNQTRTEQAETRPYTGQHQSCVGGQGQYSSWAGAVTQI